MKKCVFLMLTALLLLCCSCTQEYNNLEAEYHLQSDADFGLTASEAEAVSIPEIDNETPYRELLTKEVDIHAFMQKYCIRNGYYGEGEIETIAADIGIECLRSTEAGALYSIHKVKQGGLLYVFYYVYQEENASDYHPVVRCIYMQKKLSSKDFASVRLGTTMEEVKKIDPTAQLGENLYYSDTEWWDLFQVTTLHYLSDGVLEIGWKESDGELEVSAFRLEEDFSMTYITGRGHPYNGLILEQDWVE